MAWLLCSTVLVVGTIAVYGRTFSVPFLEDDPLSIVGNPSIRRVWPLWPVLAPPVEAGVGDRPLLNLSYALNWASCGADPIGYHLTNLAFHILACFALFGLVRRTLLMQPLAGRYGPAAPWLAFLIAGLWAWHPLQTEAVTYISQRAESLMGLFYLLVLYCFARGATSAGKGTRMLWFALSAAACFAGAATKEVMFTAPLVVLLYDRTFVSGSFARAWRQNGPICGALASSWLLLWHRFESLFAGHPVYGVGYGGGMGAWGYALTESRVVTRYLGLAFWPSPLVFDYGRELHFSLSQAWPFALALASLLAATLFALRKFPAVGFAAAWVFLILAPTSSIIPLPGQPMAESRMYLPLAGIAALAVLGVYPRLGRATFAGFVPIAILLAVAAFQRNAAYSSEITLWSDSVAKAPGNARAHGNLARVLAHVPGRLDEAAAEYKAAVAIDPGASELRVNLGNILYRLPGRLDEAVSQYEEAVSLSPDDAQAHFALGFALGRMPGRLDESIHQYGEALRLSPDLAPAHCNLGDALLKVPGRLGDAVDQFLAAIRLNPDMAEAHMGLAIALIRETGNDDRARAQLREVLRIEPGNQEATDILGNLPVPSP